MRSDSLGEAAARENSSPPRRDHLFVIVDARRACLNPDSIRNSSPHRIRRCNAGVARAESQKEVAGDDAEVPSSGMQGDADSPRFFPSPPLHSFVPSRSFSPLSSPHPRLFRFSFIQRPTRAPSLSLSPSFVSSREMPPLPFVPSFPFLSVFSPRRFSRYSFLPASF